MDGMGTIQEFEGSWAEIWYVKITWLEPNWLFQFVHGDFTAYRKICRESGVR